MSLRITSPQNPKIKHALALRERRHREASGLMLIEGRAEVALARASGASLTTLFICPELLPDPAALSDFSGADSLEVSAPVFQKMSYRENPDGMLAIAPIPRRSLGDLALRPDPLLLVCEAVEKPGNLGAMLRTADAAGADALLVCDPATDLSNPNVVRASRGALFAVPTAQAETAQALSWLRERGIRVAAAAPGASLPFTQADLRGPLAIAVGAEDRGLSELWLSRADMVVRIPMLGRINSLNVAASAAILLYEAFRQRTSPERAS
jgi:TrmH family RNA methyltransferase